MSYRREDGVPLLKPLPSRSWQVTPTPTQPPTPPSPLVDAPDSLLAEPSTPFSSTRSRSILNLTSSTLFGIYSSPIDQGSSREDISQANTPWGTGAMTPQTPSSPAHPVSEGLQKLRRPVAAHQIKVPLLSKLLRSAVLFGLGLAYGIVATHLHEETRLTPVKMEGINRHSARYMLFWGVAGLVMGNLLPYIDGFWKDTASVIGVGDRKTNQAGRASSTAAAEEEASLASGDASPRNFGADWNPVVRGIGAFIGIAFAIRKLPWESTLQASLTLALANPVLWYLIDRSATGFALSSIVGLVGAAVILGVNPGYVPSPTAFVNVTNAPPVVEKLGSLLSYEAISVSTWVASVLFCSCVCFGNIGRILASDKRVVD